MFGGECSYYTRLVADTTESAMDKLVDHGKKLEADGVVNVQVVTATTMNRIIIGLHATVIVYGTAVKLEESKE